MSVASICRPPAAVLLCGLIAGLLPPALAQNVVINEVMASNQVGIFDEDGDHSDWVEIVNRGATPVNLDGWKLSDDPEEPARWAFSNVTIAAGERLVVWASGKDRPGGSPDTTVATAPDQFAGLVAWLKADAESFANGAPVPTWTDRSGLGNDATQATASARPTFLTNAVNGHPALRFTSSSGGQLLGFPTASFSGMSDVMNFTILSVTRWTGSGGFFGAYGGSGNSGNVHFELNSPGQLRLRVSALDSLRVDDVLTKNVWSLVGASMSSVGDSPFASGYVDGRTVGTLVGGAGDALLSNYGTVGIGRSLDGRPFAGDVAEFILFNRSLSTSERGAIEKYLQQKYALTLNTETAKPHTNFAISADGETLVLSRPDGSVADTVAVPALPPEVTYGRSPDSTGSFVYFATATPAAANTATAYGPPLGRPLASQQRGFFSAPFALTLSHPDTGSGAAIYYTTNGDVPTPQSGSPYSGPITVNKTTVLRAAAYKSNTLPTNNILTETYLFLSDVITQQGTPAGYPADWGGFTFVSYGISPTVMAASGYQASITNALTSIPALSLVIPVSNMFSPGGVYAAPTTDDLERPVSAEWIHPGGVGNFQVDAGLRVQGGASRDFNNTPKKSLRLLFKSEYGPDRLEVPIFKDEGTSAADFNSIVLRGEYNNAWIHSGADQRPRALYVRDRWMRDTQVAMSGVGSRSNHVHLFINGIYWGLYNPSERADAAFAATYFGGEREDYDAMTHSGVRDGTRVAWDAMIAIARGDITQNATYEAIQQYLDVDEFIDYMILNLYGGNSDWPDNNWNATRRREPGAGYKFYAWDAERTLEGVNDNRTGVTGTSSPGELYARLRLNAEFRLRFADRARIHLFENGALTPGAAAARMQALADLIEPAIYGEEARWGAYRKEIFDRNGPSPLYSRAVHWQAEKSRLLSTYFPQRTGIFLNQLRTAGLYPTTTAPTASPAGGEYQAGASVQLSAPQGVIYYTTNGSDPRVYGTGAVSGSAQIAGGSISLSGPTTVKARAFYNGVWSAIITADFTAPDLMSELIPGGNADWTIDSNWSLGTHPNAPAARARINAPASGNREVTLRTPVTVGTLVFEQGSTAFRNRLRDTAAGSILTFDGGDEPATLRVNGTGSGFAELEFSAQIQLATDLELAVNNTAGDAEHGALRLRSQWTGAGGLIKKGPGVASLTGEDKAYTGDTLIEQGVLQVTGPSAMAQSSVSVTSGGQLRLTSSGTAASPRIYTFEGAITLAGNGRGGVPDSAGFGVSGALRADAGATNSRVVLTNPVSMAAATTLHVEGVTNRLELNGQLLGVFGFTKTGGGALALNANNANYEQAVAVSGGRLEVNASLGSSIVLSSDTVLCGSGSVANISGPGAVELDRKVLRATSSPESRLHLVLGTQGWPVLTSPAASGNGTLVLSGNSSLGDGSSPRPIDLFLAVPSLTDGMIFRGGLFVNAQSNLRAILSTATVRLFRQDAAGSVTIGSTKYTQITPPNVSLTTVPESTQLADGSTFAGEMLEVRVAGQPVEFAAWASATFTNPGDLENPSISGPAAMPFGDGISNLLRYALDLPADASATEMLPTAVFDGSRHGLEFRFDPGKLDIAYVVEASPDMTDWSRVIFDSRTSDTTAWTPGQSFSALDPLSDPGVRQFYRLRVVQLD